MPFFFPYLLKLSVCIALVFLFYRLVLRRLTFYTWNRWYLLLYSLICFFIPLVNVDPLLRQNDIGDAAFVRWVPRVPVSGGTMEEVRSASGGLSVADAGAFLFYAGLAILLLRLVIQYLSLIRLKRKAVLLLPGEVNVYQVHSDIRPFSFGRNVFLNSRQHTEADIREILRHEFVHVRQKHTIDAVWSEIFCALNWYNPFAWMLRNALRQNLEFIADDTVLQSGIDRKQYQYLLLKVMGNADFRIASPFNFSSLKKRISMMNKNKSGKRHLLRFIFIMPLLVLVLLAFRKSNDTPQKNGVRFAGMVIDRATEKPLPGVRVSLAGTEGWAISDDKGLYQLELEALPATERALNFSRAEYPASFVTIPFPQIGLKVSQQGRIVAVTGIGPAGGDAADHNLLLVGDSSGVRAAPGQLLSAYRSIQSEGEDQHSTVLTVTDTLPSHLPKEYKDFFARNPDVEDVRWKSNPLQLVVVHRGNRLSVYNLEDADQRAAAEKRYGTLPTPPPPPPAPPRAPVKAKKLPPPPPPPPKVEMVKTGPPAPPPPPTIEVIHFPPPAPKVERAPKKAPPPPRPIKEEQ